MITDPHLQTSMFSGPIPGQSLTHEPKSMPWEKPPQFTKLEDTMNHLMDQLTEPQHLKQLLGLMEGNMSIEAVARTILFTGFATGKWSADLGLLMYKPLMLSLMAIAHRAGLKDTPVVIKENLQKHIVNKIKTRAMIKTIKGEPLVSPTKTSKAAPIEDTPIDNGFMQRNS